MDIPQIKPHDLIPFFSCIPWITTSDKRVDRLDLLFSTIKNYYSFEQYYSL